MITKNNLTELVQHVKQTAIEENEAIDLTVACNNDLEYGYQTGDNSFTGDCYSFPFWAVTTIDGDTDINWTVEDLVEQLEENYTFENIIPVSDWAFGN